MVERKDVKMFSKPNSSGHSCTKSCDNRVSSFMIFNFPDTWSRADCWRVFEKYGVLKDVYLVRKRLSSGQRFGYVRFEDISDVECFTKVLNTIQINGRWIRAFKALERKQRATNRPECFDGNNSLNTTAKVDFQSAPWNHISSEPLKREGRSYADTLSGNNQNSKDLQFRVNNRIELKINGMCLEFNLPESVNNHNLMFSYNKERLSWTLVEVNYKPFDVVDSKEKKKHVEFDSKDKIILDQSNEGSHGISEDVLSECHSGIATDSVTVVNEKLVENINTSDDGIMQKAMTDSTCGSLIKDLEEGEFIPVPSLAVDHEGDLETEVVQKSSEKKEGCVNFEDSKPKIFADTSTKSLVVRLRHKKKNKRVFNKHHFLNHIRGKKPLKNSSYRKRFNWGLRSFDVMMSMEDEEDEDNDEDMSSFDSESLQDC